MAKEKLTCKFYSTRSAIDYPGMCSDTLEAAINKAERKLADNKHEEIYIVKIVKIVRRHVPKPLFDLIDVV